MHACVSMKLGVTSDIYMLHSMICTWAIFGVAAVVQTDTCGIASRCNHSLHLHPWCNPSPERCHFAYAMNLTAANVRVLQ